MGDRSGGREPKGASLKKSKKNPGAPAAKTKKVAKAIITATISSSAPMPNSDRLYFDCGAALLSRQFDKDRDRVLGRDDPFLQQKLQQWHPIITPTKACIIFLAIGAAFVPTGTSLLKTSNNVYEDRVLYDYKGSDSPCAVTSQNEGKSCQVEFELDQDVHGDLYVYYELDNYYQNHRIYVASRSATQLQGNSVSESVLTTYCNPKLKENGLILNPCGLIANSFFTGIIL
eukprot:gene18684-24437_t